MKKIIQLLFLLICFYPVILCAQLVEQNTNRSVVANAYSGLEFNSANTLVIEPDHYLPIEINMNFVPPHIFMQSDCISFSCFDIGSVPPDVFLEIVQQMTHPQTHTPQIREIPSLAKWSVGF